MATSFVNPGNSSQNIQNSLYRYRPTGNNGQVNYLDGVASGVNAPATGPTGLPTLNTDPEQPIHQMFYQDQAIENAGANQINDEAQSQLNHYGGRQLQQEGNVDQSLQQLNSDPGYNGPEQALINPGFSQYRTSGQGLANNFLTGDEQQSIYGSPSAGWTQTQQDTANENAKTGDYGTALNGAVGNYAQGTNAGLGTLNTDLSGATGALDQGLNASQGKFGKLDSAVNNSQLGFDPNGTERQLSDSDVQNMKTAAGTRVGNQYRSAEDSLYRNAAAAGNTSPLALAAANERLQRDSAAGQGDAELSADVAARQAQQDRASQIEAQRLGATQSQAGMQANAATQEQAQAQAAAGQSGQAKLTAATTAGTQAVQAGKDIGQAGINAANSYGTAAMNNASNVAGQNYNAVTNADNTSAARASQIATNRQAAQNNVNNTQYTQGMGTATADSQAGQAIGNARIAGNTAYRAGVAGQAAAAQQGGQAAVDQQNTALGTLTNGLNTSTNNRANYENTGPGALGKAGSSILGGVLGAAGNAAPTIGKAAGLAEGGAFDEPTMARVGESGPEMVFSQTHPEGQKITRPMYVMLGKDQTETVVPLNSNPNNKMTLPTRYRAA